MNVTAVAPKAVSTRSVWRLPIDRARDSWGSVYRVISHAPVLTIIRPDGRPID
jgi:hypothetical protein